ncbi:hypothetical protein [Labrys monachus]|uniref:Uncharacterized protein n=1 Tax=Labrys monachus TaxID=217067 RepID=A0ABU0F9T1_9HYPH|nr:hypothetical protein [Labrys monachus]MDQ0391373.1 hypothetical protein [Labrys monachus]
MFEESAYRIVDIFWTRNVPAGEPVLTAAIELLFDGSGCPDADFRAGLAHAVVKGWIEENASTISLTQAGYQQF